MRVQLETEKNKGTNSATPISSAAANSCDSMIAYCLLVEKYKFC